MWNAACPVQSMKLLRHCAGVPPHPSNFHLPFRLQVGSSHSHSQRSRNMVTGLLYVSSRPLDLHPNAPASLAVKKVMRETTRQLQLYDIIYYRSQTAPRGLALSLFDDLAKTRTQAAQLHPLPPQSRDSIDAELEAEAYHEPPVEETPDGPDLPPELQPVLMPSGLPDPPDDESEIINDGYDFDFDGLDLKNLPDYDPYYDHEMDFFTDDAVNAWIKADQDECAKGAVLRLYESIDIPNDNPAPTYSEAHETFLATPRMFTALPLSFLASHTTSTYLSPISQYHCR